VVACILPLMIRCLVAEVAILVSSTLKLHQVRDMILLDLEMDLSEVVGEDLRIHLVGLEAMISSKWVNTCTTVI
jgi:hypothetical protein